MNLNDNIIIIIVEVDLCTVDFHVFDELTIKLARKKKEQTKELRNLDDLFK